MVWKVSVWTMTVAMLEPSRRAGWEDGEITVLGCTLAHITIARDRFRTPRAIRRCCMLCYEMTSHHDMAYHIMSYHISSCHVITSILYQLKHIIPNDDELFVMWHRYHVIGRSVGLRARSRTRPTLLQAPREVARVQKGPAHADAELNACATWCMSLCYCYVHVIVMLVLNACANMPEWRIASRHSHE